MRYPLGEQDFHNLRKEGYLYVDKTAYIPLLLRNKYYFLSRPRRFGKSLLLSTLEQFFLGNKDLFEGLSVSNFDWDWDSYPVFRIDLSSGSYSQPGGLEARLWRIVKNIEKSYGVSGEGQYPGDYLDSLISAVKTKYGRDVVILIDEYEKPLLDTISRSHHDQYVDQLRDFYSVLKDNVRNIRFLFITGVTRFGHLNIFSGLNNLTDISLDDDYAAICGITEGELHSDFREGVARFGETNGLDIDETYRRLKHYYDGYHFSQKLVDVYNPYSLMEALRSGRFTSVWFESGSSTYLINRLRENRYDLTRLEGITATEKDLKGADASMSSSVTLLYQSGYLTIKAYHHDQATYTLGLPNYEVSSALYSAIIPYFLGSNYSVRPDQTQTVLTYLRNGEAQKAMEWLKGFFSSIPYDVHLNYERDFQYIIYSFFALIGLQAQTTLEKQTSEGRIDMVLTIGNYVYIFEFKRGEDASKAMNQIEQRHYKLPYSGDQRKIIRIAVAFSPASRGISSFLIQ